MNRKHFFGLLGISVVVAVVALLMPGKTGHEDIAEKAVLVPGLQAQVNDIAWLRISGAGGTVVATLVRREDRWSVEEAYGYRADWARLQPLLAGLASARAVEPKTENPAYYDRLGVEDVGSESATGHLVEFGEATGLPAIIIGKPAQGRSGHYARLRDGDQSVLTDQSFDLPSDRQGWLDRDVADIGEAEVVEIEIHHPDGERLVARKTSADDTNFELLGVAEGFEPRSDWTVNSLAGNLAALTLESVAPADGIDWTGATRFRLLTADGLNAEAALVETAAADGEGSEFWLRLEAGVYTTAVESGVDTDVDPADTEERAAAINDRVGGWAYRIPKYKFDAMVKRMDDLVQEIATDSP